MNKENTLYRLSSYDFNKENPFIKQAVEQVQSNVVKKYKTASKTGQKAILRAVTEDGEILGHTQFIRQIEVDEQQFAKLYLSNFSGFFDLKAAAIRVFGYILGQLVPNKDEFVFLLDDCLEYTGYKTKASVFQGLGELVESEIIARGKTDFLYYINPMVVFNGNRITFAKTYIKKQEIKNKEINSNQIDLFDQIEEIENERSKK